MPDSFLRKKTVVAAIVILIIAFMGGFLYMTSEGSQKNQNQNPQATPPENNAPLGTLGAVCGGSNLLPCMPGLVCSTPVDQLKEKEGTCVTDTRTPAKVAKEGEECDGTDIVCEPGFACQPTGQAGQDVNGKKECSSIAPDQRSFIMSLVPEGMILNGGVYQAKAGTDIHVVVQALNVSTGDLYFLPATSSKSDAGEEDKISKLSPVQGKDNTYDATFTVKPNMLGSLIVKMKGKDGQEQRLQVTVGSK
ncbi:MAG: hypothetical protein WC477_04670 [Patescibacteria group bacterium]